MKHVAKEKQQLRTNFRKSVKKNSKKSWMRIVNMKVLRMN